MRPKWQKFLFGIVFILCLVRTTAELVVAQEAESNEWLKSVEPLQETRPTQKNDESGNIEKRRSKNCSSVNRRLLLRGYHVQVGALPSREEAEQRIISARASLSYKLKSHQDIITTVRLRASYEMPERILYRARFIGFSRDAAYQACNSLKEYELPCAPMKARTILPGCKFN